MSENDIKPVAWVERTESGHDRMWSYSLESWANRPANPEPLYEQSAIDALTKQIGELKTMLSIAEFQRKEMQEERDDLNSILMALQARHREVMAERDAAVADRDALSTMLAVAGGRLEEAANEIEDWGAYADEYFQKKHLLAEVVQSFRDDAKDAADAARAEEGQA